MLPTRSRLGGTERQGPSSSRRLPHSLREGRTLHSAQVPVGAAGRPGLFLSLVAAVVVSMGNVFSAGAFGPFPSLWNVLWTLAFLCLAFSLFLIMRPFHEIFLFISHPTRRHDPARRCVTASSSFLCCLSTMCYEAKIGL
eukprot:6213121-Pleurochrysis_carterae.AAC.3